MANNDLTKVLKRFHEKLRTAHSMYANQDAQAVACAPLMPSGWLWVADQLDNKPTEDGDEDGLLYELG